MKTANAESQSVRTLEWLLAPMDYFAILEMDAVARSAFVISPACPILALLCMTALPPYFFLCELCFRTLAAVFCGISATVVDSE
jgi:hypothetical protein